MLATVKTLNGKSNPLLATPVMTSSPKHASSQCKHCRPIESVSYVVMELRSVRTLIRVVLDENIGIATRKLWVQRKDSQARSLLVLE